MSRGKNQCVENAQKWSPYLKDWFQNHQEVVLNLKEWLCIDKIQVCCLDEHFGPNCQKCMEYGKNGKVCSGNGKCKGSGSRKGNGACLCDSGYVGSACQKCSSSYYLSYEDSEKTLCSPCHHSCNGDCSGAGPVKCFACKKGFVMHAEHGCQDIGNYKFLYLIYENYNLILGQS